MRPELILQTDLLDILFDNRNKEYGAYALRKQYDARLNKAMSVTFGLTFLLSFSWYVHVHYFKNPGSVVAGQPTTEVHLKSIDDAKKAAEPQQPRPVVKKRIAQIANPPIKIVPDDLADKQVPTIDDLNKAVISTVTKDGSVDEGIPGPPAVGTGDKNGPVIEPQKETPAAEMAPLVRAEVMPEFPGGPEAFKKFLLRNLAQPDDLQEGEKIVVLIKFVVEADESIVNTEVLKSGGKYDVDVLKVVRRMPKWKPGMQNGRFVPVYFNLPVTFTGPEN